MAWICGKCIFTVYLKMVPSGPFDRKGGGLGVGWGGGIK